MNKIKNNKFLKVSLGAVLFFALALIVRAAGLDVRGPQTVTVNFPVAELGNCNSKQECKTYCDKAENISACAAFAQAHGLITIQEKQQADKLSEALKKSAGPGGCTDAETCKTYCADPTHTDECVAFAQTNNLLPQEKINAAKNVGQALKTGAGPGACKNETDCKTFCSKTENQQVCLDFAKKHNLISQDQASTLDKFSQAVKDGQTPGGCTTKEACQTYCQDQTHKDECLQFLVKIGGIDQSAVSVIKQSGNKGPGGCDSAEACKTYCQEQTHQQECLDFAKQRGLNVTNPKNETGDQESQGGPGGDVMNCVRSVLGSQATSTLDTSNLTADQKTAIANCGHPKQGESGNNSGPVGQSIKNCLIKVLGTDAVNNLDTTSLTADQKTAIAKCRPGVLPPGNPPFKNASGTPPHLPTVDTAKIKQCLQEKLGADGMQKLASGTPEVRQQYADILKQCGYNIPSPNSGQNPENKFPGTNIPKEPLMPINPGGMPGGNGGSGQGMGQKPPLPPSGKPGSPDINLGGMPEDPGSGGMITPKQSSPSFGY